ncbi:helix-turn-helix domain-containing protein [Clostridium perfringens]|nr:helix-turn-helix transcriptional regulator [Clostridium perfringens]
MKERLLALRKELKLTQSEFAKKIQISRSHLSGLENGTRNFTERVISDICREFDVNRNWLENGEGDMFIDILAEIDEFNNADKDVQEMVRLYMQLDDVTRAYFKKKMLDELKK